MTIRYEGPDSHQTQNPNDDSFPSFAPIAPAQEQLPDGAGDLAMLTTMLAKPARQGTDILTSEASDTSDDTVIAAVATGKKAAWISKEDTAVTPEAPATKSPLNPETIARIITTTGHEKRGFLKTIPQKIGPAVVAIALFAGGAFAVTKSGGSASADAQPAAVAADTLAGQPAQDPSFGAYTPTPTTETTITPSFTEAASLPSGKAIEIVTGKEKVTYPDYPAPVSADGLRLNPEAGVTRMCALEQAIINWDGVPESYVMGPALSLLYTPDALAAAASTQESSTLNGVNVAQAKASVGGLLNWIKLGQDGLRNPTHNPHNIQVNCVNTDPSNPAAISLSANGSLVITGGVAPIYFANKPLKDTNGAEVKDPQALNVAATDFLTPGAYKLIRMPDGTMRLAN